MNVSMAAGNVAKRSDRIEVEGGLAVRSGHCASLRSRLPLPVKDTERPWPSAWFFAGIMPTVACTPSGEMAIGLAACGQEVDEAVNEAEAEKFGVVIFFVVAYFFSTYFFVAGLGFFI